MFKYADYIYEIYKERSFTKAAKNLFVSQPALSATVRKAEEEMQIQIFDRSVSPLKLTPEGEAYIKAIEDIRVIKNDYRNFITDISNLNIGSISVSGANFISSYVLPKIIVPFSEKHPMINISLLESNSKTLVQQLLDEKIELLIDYAYDEEVIESYPLFEETILLCVPSSLAINSELRSFALDYNDICTGKHLDEKCASVSPQIFKNENFLMLKQGNSMNYHGFEICRNAGFTPKVSIYLDQLMTSYNMSASGLGICFITDTLVTSAPQSDNLVYYKIDSYLAKRTVFLLRKKKKYLNKAICEFIKTACEVFN